MSRMPRQKPHRSKQDYSTPENFIEAVKVKLGIEAFGFDFAADASNKKADCWWGVADDALSKSTHDWRGWLGADWGWLNPPFEKIDPWAAKCWQLKQAGGRVAFLVPASVGANWFRDFVHGKALVLFLNGRLAFIEGKPRELYIKDCVLCLYAPELAPGYKVWTWKRTKRQSVAA